MSQNALIWPPRFSTGGRKCLGLCNLRYLVHPRALGPRNLRYLVHPRALGPRILRYLVQTGGVSRSLEHHFCRYLRDRRGFLGLKLVTVRGSSRSFVSLESLNSRQYIAIATFLSFAVSSCAIFCCYLLYRLRLSGSRALFFVAICVTVRGSRLFVTLEAS